MKHRGIAFFATISLVTSAAVDKTKAAKAEFYKNWRNDTALQQGGNIEVVDFDFDFDVDYFVGVAFDIHNQSPFKLTQPKFYPHCRGGKQVAKLSSIFFYGLIGI